MGRTKKLIPAMRIDFESSLARLDSKYRLRGAKKMIKAGLFDTARDWQEKMLPRHFTRKAPGLYRYGRKKIRRGGVPLVETGTLRDRASMRSHMRITGTSKRVTLTFAYGRPPHMTAEFLEKCIWAYIAERHGVDAYRHSGKNARERLWQQARSAVYSRAGYGTKNRKRFQDWLTRVHSSEPRRLAKNAERRMAKALQADGRRRKRRRIT
jgi:hypothetical protein